jgi:hypothetical protein
MLDKGIDVNHILAIGAAHAVTIHPGVFKILGHTIPVLLGQVLHWIAYYGSLGYKVIVVALTVLLFKTKGNVELWKIAVLLVEGCVVVPSFSPKMSHYTSDITHGSAVGTTGASAGLFFLGLGIMAVVIYRMIIKPPIVVEEEVEQK